MPPKTASWLLSEASLVGSAEPRKTALSLRLTSVVNTLRSILVDDAVAVGVVERDRRRPVPAGRIAGAVLLIEADEDRAHPLAQLQDLVLRRRAAQRQVPRDAGLVDDPAC